MTSREEICEHGNWSNQCGLCTPTTVEVDACFANAAQAGKMLGIDVQDWHGVNASQSRLILALATRLLDAERRIEDLEAMVVP